MGTHLSDGKFQSDKYPTCPAGKVPLSVTDRSAQGLLWEYAQRRRAIDAEFSGDLETALRAAGFEPATGRAGAPLTTEQILAAKARADAATDGPWWVVPFKSGAACVMAEHTSITDGIRGGEVSVADGTFVADARQTLPRLADDLLAANARCAAWERLYRTRCADPASAEHASALAAARALGLDV